MKTQKLYVTTIIETEYNGEVIPCAVNMENCKDIYHALQLLRQIIRGDIVVSADIPQDSIKVGAIEQSDPKTTLTTVATIYKKEDAYYITFKEKHAEILAASAIQKFNRNK
jgi:hypothetical protein